MDKTAVGDVGDIDILFDRAVTGDYEENEDAWEAVSALRRLGTEQVLKRAIAMTASPNAMARARGADVLGQLGATTENSQGSFSEERYLALSGLLDSEQEALPLTSAIAAAGHLGDSRAIPQLLKFADHQDSAVRFDLAFSLGCFPFTNDASVRAALLQLMEDEDSDVRDWATFAIGCQCEEDSPKIRDALFARIDDECEGAQGEAIAGLAKRRDLRALPLLLSWLDQGYDGSFTLESAQEFLDLERTPPDWTPAQYAAALRSRFGL